MRNSHHGAPQPEPHQTRSLYRISIRLPISPSLGHKQDDNGDHALTPVPCRHARLAICSAAARRLLSLENPIFPRQRPLLTPPSTSIPKNSRIAAEPFRHRGECKIFQVDYLQVSLSSHPIIVTNSPAIILSHCVTRASSSSAGGDKSAAEPEDQAPVRPKDSRGHDIPVAPLNCTPRAAPPTTRISRLRPFEYAALAVEPILRRRIPVYDMRVWATPPLARRETVLPRAAHSDGNELSISKIPFDKYLESEALTPSNAPCPGSDALLCGSQRIC